MSISCMSALFSNNNNNSDHYHLYYYETYIGFQIIPEL